VPAEVGRGPNLSFAPGPPVESLPEGDARSDEASKPLRPDFSNYTVGRLFKDRRNYEMNHEGYQKALTYIRGVTWASGWRANIFKRVYEKLSLEYHFSHEQTNLPQRLDRSALVNH